MEKPTATTTAKSTTRTTTRTAAKTAARTAAKPVTSPTTRPATRPTTRPTMTPGPDTPRQHDGHNGEFTLNLPMVSLQFHRPHLGLPHVEMPHVSRQEVGHAMDVARSFLPPPERVAYYGGLGALAILGVIEWPVAAAIGVGTVLAQRGRTEESKAWSRERRVTPVASATRTARAGR
ncbi:hypothetical protein IMZ11_21980 [Microtetraspora sp. AC03309]|uniref:hypothetical protein n=1 Tax=Microtetraspora sp. AC03309 TaxID=2779376 RepID=UPI001E488D1E|nr:hypothetical protein [Microtetraspora sp. AC03309]MCC5578300.1 hypothetical protein [Microtetraspora sp. AC03309]